MYMVIHMVFWKLKEHAEGADKATNAERIIRMLNEMHPKVPHIFELTVGTNFNASNEWDLGLSSKFRTPEDLQEYIEHPEHQKVAEFISKVRTERAVVDYEV